MLSAPLNPPSDSGAGTPSLVAMVDGSGRRGHVFRYGDALASGLSRGQLRGQLTGGQLVRLRRGVYGSGGEELAAIAAAALRVDGAAVSHETAARLWGLALLGRSPESVQLTRSRRRTGRDNYPGVAVHHATLPDRHRTTYRGVPITTPARTVIDLARAGAFRAGVCAADSALRLRRCTGEELLAVVVDCAGWPGVRRARQVAQFADGRAANPLESISRVAFWEHGLPSPQLQAEVLSLDIVDFLWEDFRVAGEADGMGKYVDADVLRREKHRQERLERDGLAVVRWTWPEVFHRPDAVAHRAAQCLYRRGWRP